jgi:tetratricopeptide (TPR) repeat protein
MGGVGKTQLAVEFAYRYGRFFHGVHWVNAGSPAGLGAEVAACGAAMGLTPWPEKLPEQVARTLEAWRRGGPRLVVLDNLEEVDPAREWLGRLSGGGARVLVTARRQDWPRDLGLDPLRLEVFSEEESREFLREYLGEGRATDEELDELAERLGYLPLALELAGRYLGGLARLTVGEYLEKIEDVWAHPSMADWREELGNPTGHDLDLAKTFAASWERVEDETARWVFLMLGWCAPSQAVPCEVLERAAGLDTEACDAAVGVLAGLGLVEVEDPQVGPLVHPLLGEFARALPDAGEALEKVAGALVQMARKANAEMDETGSPSHFEPLLPHVRAMAEGGGTEAPPDDGSLWVNLGYYLERVADYRGARTACERGVSIGERVYGLDHQEVALRVNNLGDVLRAQGDLAGARGCFERALGIWRAAYGEEHPQVATVHNNLGRVLQAQGDLAGARECFERALEIDEQVYGPEHPDVARDVNNLGDVLRAQGDLAGARGCFERAVGIDERVYGPGHPEVARDVNNLGSVLQDQGDLAGARECYERALEIDERVYGPEHPDVATDVNNLGSVLYAQGDLAGARGCCERALGIWRVAYGEDHPQVATAHNNLGSVLKDQGDLAGARVCFERALGILEKFLPEGHPDIEWARGSLESLGE